MNLVALPLPCAFIFMNDNLKIKEKAQGSQCCVSEFASVFKLKQFSIYPFVVRSMENSQNWREREWKHSKAEKKH